MTPAAAPYSLPSMLAHERYRDDFFEPRIACDARQHLQRFVLYRPLAARPGEVLCDAVLNCAAPSDVNASTLESQRIDVARDASVVDGVSSHGFQGRGIS